MSKMHVAFAVNESYLPYCAVALTSICCHLPSREEIEFHILHNGSISEAARRAFFDKTPCLKNKARRAEFVEMKDRLGISKKVITTAHITEETYFRLYLHEVFPDIDTMLYLDADIVVRHTIRELFDFDVSDCCIAGVEDIKSYTFLGKLKLPRTEKYINGGVVLMNLANIRKIDVTAKLTEILESQLPRIITAGDQDLMALLFRGRIAYLPIQWNIVTQTQDLLKSRCGIVNDISLPDMSAARAKPYILHYIGPDKPWKGATSTEYSYLWHIVRWFDYAPETGYYTSEHEQFRSRNISQLKKIWIKDRLAPIFNIFKKIFSKIFSTRRMLRQTRNELQQTQSTLKNMLLYANAQKKAGDEFLPESLYQTPGRRVATFERDEHLAPGGFKDTYHILFNTNTLQEIKNNVHVDESDYSVFHFWRDDFRNSQQVWALYKSILGTPAYFVEASFITSIHAFTTKSWPIQFRRLYSFLADDLSFYFDALQPGRIAQYLNSAEARLDAEQQRRCRELIRYIVDNRLTKYNFLSLAEPEVLNKPGRKVLVVDQTAGDASITRGRASADSFKRMLKAAVQENQGAAIYVKTHPDTVTRAKRCYYADVAEAEVIKLTEAVNPYSILRHMDKVYVCTSQLGLEALMAGKEVVTFGQPIYAGWGLTDDRLPGAARGNQLTLEDLFFALYIKFAVHIHPYTYTICPIEDYLPAMVKLREEYFKYLEDTGKKA